MLAPTEQPENVHDVTFDDLFDLEDIQRLQDEFADATGVASIITLPDGTPITTPSRFTRFCNDIVRKTEKGCANCYRSDAVIGRLSGLGPTIQPCMSGGLWDAGAGISVGGKHVANWLIGQVRDMTQSEERIRLYAKEIGANESEAISAFREVPSMSRQKFDKIAQMLYTLANQLSQKAYQNLRQQRLIAELKLSETKLQLAANVFTHAREGIMITDRNGIIVDVNQTFSQITGYPREEVLGKNPSILRSEQHDASFYKAMWRSLKQTGHWTGEIWNRHKKGKAYAELLTISAVHDCDGKTQNYVALFTDITQMKLHEKQLEQMAHYDVLTGLPNRVLFADRLRRAITHCQRNKQSLAVVYLDIDGFKEVNDQLGHDMGDEMLIALSQQMKAAIREVDILARVGGDEFVAVLVDLDHPHDCKPVIERLLQAAASKVTIDGISLQSSASIGVTIFPQDAVDADQLLRHADQAMYEAKQAGGNRYHLFDFEMAVALKNRMGNMERIRLALDRKEFVLYYQPKVNLKSGKLIGAEALIRWQHPERGLLAPLEFLPIVEDHVIGVEIGEWVIHTALDQIEDWQKLGWEIPVSVNISARQLQQDNFVSSLSRKMSDHRDVKPQLLQLEITETTGLKDMAHVFEVMQACKAMGVSFALDDFGTGYSSLVYLKRLPFDVLKIDQGFIRNMLEDAEDRAIVQAVIQLAKAFHRDVIAEGVEVMEHSKILLSVDCEMAQGYCFAHPMPPAELPAWAAAWESRVSQPSAMAF